MPHAEHEKHTGVVLAHKIPTKTKSGGSKRCIDVPGRKSNLSKILARISLSGMVPVPYVSTNTDSGWATPMAYETYRHLSLNDLTKDRFERRRLTQCIQNMN